MSVTIGSPVHNPNEQVLPLEKDLPLGSDEEFLVDEDDFPDANLKKEHIHLLLMTPRRVRVSTAFAIFQKLLGEREKQITQVFRVGSLRSYLRYLTHLDSFEKQQFVPNEFSYFFLHNRQGAEFYLQKYCSPRYSFLTDLENEERFLRFIEVFALDNQINNYADLLVCLEKKLLNQGYGYEYVCLYRKIIRRHKTHFVAFCSSKSKHHKEQVLDIFDYEASEMF